MLFTQVLELLMVLLKLLGLRLKPLQAFLRRGASRAFVFEYRSGLSELAVEILTRSSLLIKAAADEEKLAGDLGLALLLLHEEVLCEAFGRGGPGRYRSSGLVDLVLEASRRCHPLVHAQDVAAQLPGGSGSGYPRDRLPQKLQRPLVRENIQAKLRSDARWSATVVLHCLAKRKHRAIDEFCTHAFPHSYFIDKYSISAFVFHLICERFYFQAPENAVETTDRAVT
jgi:hypothetical protein